MSTNNGMPKDARYAALLEYLVAREHGRLREWEAKYQDQGPHWMAGFYGSILDTVLTLCPPPLLLAIIDAIDAAQLAVREQEAER